ADARVDDATPGIKNVRLIRPGLSPDLIFDPRFEAAIDPFTLVRFMPQGTNFSDEVDWTDRTSPTWFNQSKSLTPRFETRGDAYEYRNMMRNKSVNVLNINKQERATND